MSAIKDDSITTTSIANGYVGGDKLAPAGPLPPDIGPIKVWWEDSYYVACGEHMPSLSGIGDTPEQALAELRIACGVPAGPLPTLMPCPYCGSTRLEWEVGAITCRDCEARGPQSEKHKLAVSGWNTRAAAADVTQLVTDVLDGIEHIWLETLIGDDGPKSDLDRQYVIDVACFMQPFRERLARALVGRG